MSALPDLAGYDIRLLKVFRAVVEAKSYTAAELSLNKSKSAISTDITALETRLGVRLCRRGRAGFQLTSEGQAIYDLSLQLFTTLTDFRDRLGRIASCVGGELSVVLDEANQVRFSNQMSAALSAHRKLADEIFLNVRVASADQVIRSVLDGQSDVGITAIGKSFPELREVPIVEDELTLYCGQAHKLYPIAGGRISVEHLAQHDCIDPGMAVFDDSRARGRLRIAATAPSEQSRLMLIRTGQYIGYLSDEVARPFANELRAIRHPELRCRNVIAIISQRRGNVSAIAELFMRSLRQEFSAVETKDLSRQVTRANVHLNQPRLQAAVS